MHTHLKGAKMKNALKKSGSRGVRHAPFTAGKDKPDPIQLDSQPPDINIITYNLRDFNPCE